MYDQIQRQPNAISRAMRSRAVALGDVVLTLEEALVEAPSLDHTARVAALEALGRVTMAQALRIIGLEQHDGVLLCGRETACAIARATGAEVRYAEQAPRTQLTGSSWTVATVARPAE